VWLITKRMLEDRASAFDLIRVASSVVGSALITRYAWRRRAAWWTRQTTSDDQLVIVFLALAAANAVLCYAYTKDVILSPAGAFYAVALAIAARDLVDRAGAATLPRVAAAAVVLVALSAGWAVRFVAAQLDLRASAETVRLEWAYVDVWMADQGVTPSTDHGRAIVQRLQDDAVSAHAGRPRLTGRWLTWFEE
jgi:hypothetical protein